MVLYTILPPEDWGDAALPQGSDDEGQPADQPAASSAAPVELFAGWSGDVPVWVQVVPVPGGWQVVRLLTTDPSLYLHPGLAPGSFLPRC